ncbi:MAG: hypothetical protein NVSMB44_32910 [Ktedonobacteraceae bacterium]
MVSHPWSIYIWQPKRRGGTWIEPLQVATEQCAIYVAQLIHKENRAVIKVTRYGAVIAWFPDEETVEKIEKYIARHEQLQEPQ